MAQFDKARRLKLKAGKKPYFERVGRGLALGYRRNAGAGVWVIREILDDGNSRLRKFATADDLEAANGVDVLTYAQALQYANRVALKSAKTQTVTVEDAISDYEEDLMARGLNVRARYNATVLRYYLKDLPFYKKPVSLLEKKALTEVRDGMVASGKKPATADRLGASLRAALNLAASRDPRITNARVWKEGWKSCRTARWRAPSSCRMTSSPRSFARPTRPITSWESISTCWRRPERAKAGCCACVFPTCRMIPPTPGS